jgi:hypothetical protein
LKNRFTVILYNISLGSLGCHLATMAENISAIAFFESAGFRRYGPPTLIPGLRTPDRKRMHQQVMVREVDKLTPADIFPTQDS